MPPETVVLAAEQGIHQCRRKGFEPAEFAVSTGIHRLQRLVVAVVDSEGAAHAGQSTADGHMERGQRHQQARTANADQNADTEIPLQTVCQTISRVLERKRWSACLMCWRKADAVAVLQLQLPHPSTSPPEPVG